MLFVHDILVCLVFVPVHNILVQGKAPEYTGTGENGIPLLVCLFISGQMYSMLILFIKFRGAEPRKLAFSTAVGTALGVFPIFGIFFF
jgi:hypothetical protein